MSMAQNRRLRISSCIRTIIDVHSRCPGKSGSEEMLEKFRRLEKTVDALENPHISEGDVRRVEKATNRLLEKITRLMKVAEPMGLAGKSH